jgi:probable rRNA maturation factor
MAYNIEIINDVHLPDSGLEAIQFAAQTTLDLYTPAREISLSILLTDNQTLRELNRQYRGEDHATDVLSFPAGDPIPGVNDMEAYLGDIAISLPFAEDQAREKDHPVIAELQLLTIHGVLHLLDFDHVDAEQKKVMWSVQETVLSRLGLSPIQPSEEEYDA